MTKSKIHLKNVSKDLDTAEQQRVKVQSVNSMKKLLMT